jgi:hypothetical protein
MIRREIVGDSRTAFEEIGLPKPASFSGADNFYRSVLCLAALA